MRLKKLLLLPFLLFLFACSSDDGGSGSGDDDKPKPNVEKKISFNITSSGLFTCARYAQKIKCWGRNNARLGLENTADRGGTQAEMDSIPYVDLGDNFETIDVKSGINHTCALSASGNVKCWGNTDGGYLGTEGKPVIGRISNDMGNHLNKIELGDNFTVTKLFEGGNCAQIQSGDVKCWGLNDWGQLGRGDNIQQVGYTTNTMSNDLPKINLGQTFDVKKIITTEYNACALNQSGDMKCWGRLLKGIPGFGYTDKVGDETDEMGKFLRTMDLGNEFIVSDFDLVNTHVCALSTTGKLKCWGYNDDGQLGQDHKRTLGDGVGELGNALVAVNLGFTVKQVKVGRAHTCVLSTEGRIKCWGYNNYGGLGYGDKVNRGEGVIDYTMGDLDYVNLGDDFRVTSIELGAYHSCAISSKYEVKCWGRSADKRILAGAAGGDAGDAGDVPNEMGNNLKVMKIFHDETF